MEPFAASSGSGAGHQGNETSTSEEAPLARGLFASGMIEPRPRAHARAREARSADPTRAPGIFRTATAPAEIADDVEANNEWNRTRKVELLEQFDYDLRRLMLEGSAEELAAWNYIDPAIAEQESRVVAYQEQVCGAVS